ncbi:MAG TPA: PilZ domain-containing protein [Pirellulaceae bacterium]|nr:PilZ domain-containing protein [Pirellulaceae bacterium]
MTVTQEMIDALFEPEMVETLCGQPKQGPAVLPGAERGSARVPFRGRAVAIVFPPPSSPQAEPVESEVVTTDISRGGLSLLHRRELHRGQQVLLQLTRGTCTVEVCWCCRVWPGLYIAGCRFADMTFADAAS